MSADKTGETAQRATGELVRQSLQKGSPVRVSLATASMSPNLLPGDELIVEAAEWQKLKTGDIVLYERSEVLFAHRLIRVERQPGGARLITKGDAAGSYDSPVSIASYLGKVARVVRGGHHINLEGRGARAGARLRVVRSMSRSMITRLRQNIQQRLGIVSLLILALVLFGAASALAAVTISSFTASGGQGKIVLTWTTATEIHNWGFNLYRSTDQTNWGNPITFVQSDSLCNSSAIGNSYSYTDNSSDLVITTTYYYRLQSLGRQCTDSDVYYERIVSAAPNGGKNPGQQTVVPTATPTVQPSATATPQATFTPTSVPPTSVPPTATPTNVPQATSTDTPQAQNTQAPTNTPLPTKTPVSSTALRSTPTATLTGVTRLPTMAGPVATQPPAGTEQPTPAVATDAPTADAPTASPAATEVAIVVASDTPPSAGPQGSSRPVQLQPTPAPAVAGSLLVGLGLVGVLGMGAAGFLLLGLAGIVIWRLYARG